MDLLSISPCETAEMPLCHPVSGAEITGADGLPVIFRLAGADSLAFRAASRGLANARLTRKRTDASAEQADRDSLELLSACVMGWSANFTLGGVAPEYSKEAAAILLSGYPWVREQVDAFIGKRANFLPKA